MGAVAKAQQKALVGLERGHKSIASQGPDDKAAKSESKRSSRSGLPSQGWCFDTRAVSSDRTSSSQDRRTGRPACSTLNASDLLTRTYSNRLVPAACAVSRSGRDAADAQSAR